MSSELIGKKLRVALEALREVNRALADEYARLVAKYGVDEGGGKRYAELTSTLRGHTLKLLASAEELRDLVLQPEGREERREVEDEVGEERRREYGGKSGVKRGPCGKPWGGGPHRPYMDRGNRGEGGGRGQKWTYLGK